MDENNTQLLEHAADIVSAFVGSNSVQTDKLPALISEVYAKLAGLKSGEAPIVELTPAVDPKKSVKPDHIICLDDGKKFKSLKRHLSILGMTPDEYRTKWGLPRDYPMVAPNYAAARSELAKSIGLGRKREPVKKDGRKRAQQ